MTGARVAILTTQPETILADYQRLAGLAGLKGALDAGARTIVKDNISWHLPLPSANTTPWQLEGCFLALRAAGFEHLSCVHNRTVVLDALKGIRLNGYGPICEAHRVPELFNFRPSDMRWIEYLPKGELLVLGRIFEGRIALPEYFVGKNVVHLPTCKTHIYTTTTGAMKNAFGGLLDENRHWAHSWIHEALVDLLRIQLEIHTGLFAFMDGTSAGNGAGPRLVKPETKNVILASADQVAIDAVAAKLMGFDPLQIKYIALAHEARLGTGNPREIEVVGDVAASQQNWGFRVGRNLHSILGWLAWYGPTRCLQRAVFRGPLVSLTYPVSGLYHDQFRWRTSEGRIFRRWRSHSPWGRLFGLYMERGCLAAPAS